MRKFREIAKKFVVKHGAVIASCAFAFVAFSANSSCLLPFFEPEEPKGITNFKKFNR
ncbi:MAG: cyclic lactone autoinducer peptide [Clostridia bacterium]|nr:cyclic lactone autoinducer peptide [Clostridia bacterium]